MHQDLPFWPSSTQRFLHIPNQACEYVKQPAFLTQSRDRGFGSSADQFPSDIEAVTYFLFTSSQHQLIVDECCVGSRISSEVCVQRCKRGQPRDYPNCPATLRHQPKFNVCAKLRNASLANYTPGMGRICSLLQRP